MSKKTKKKERNVETENHEVEKNLESSIPQEAIAATEESLGQESNQPEEVFQTTQILIGDFLREKREEKDLSLKLISQHTKISYTQLENLEKNNLEVLPNKAYVTGFVKSYCKTIGLDQATALAILETSYGNSPQEEPIAVVQKTVTQAPKENSSTPVILGVIAIALVVIGGLIWRSNQAPTQEVVEEAPIKTQTLTETTPLSTSSEIEKPVEITPTAETKPQKVEEVVKEVKKVEVKPEKEVVVEKKEKIEKKETGEKKLQFRALTLPLYTPNTKMATSEINTLIPSSYRGSLVSGKQNVFINATEGDTWITYKADDNPIKKFILKSGRTLLIRGDVLRIFLGNINITRVFLNNKPLNIQSRSGVKSLVFPQEKASQYKLPLFIYQKSGKVITSEEYIAENDNV